MVIHCKNIVNAVAVKAVIIVGLYINGIIEYE